MSGFQLDTSGVVRVPLPFKVKFESPHGSPTYNPRTRETRAWTNRYFATKDEAMKFCGGNARMVKRAPGEAHKPVAWSDLDAFTQGYIEALLSSVVGVDPSDGLPRGAGFADLAPETLAKIIEDCSWFRAEEWPDADQVKAGREYWHARNKAESNVYRPLTVTLGDDGKVYVAPAQGPSQ